MTATVLPTQEKLTADEMEQARLFLLQTLNSIVGATKRLSEAQWKFKPAPDRWSIAENLAHVVIVQERMLGAILHQIAHAPAPPADRDHKLVDSIVIHQFPTRLNKFQAPEIVYPVDRIEPEVELARLRVNYARLTERLESAEGLRQHAVAAPPLRAVSNGAYDLMDGYQWILATAAHTERHTKQMLEVMADPSFPV